MYYRKQDPSTSHNKNINNYESTKKAISVFKGFDSMTYSCYHKDRQTKQQTNA